MHGYGLGYGLGSRSGSGYVHGYRLGHGLRRVFGYEFSFKGYGIDKFKNDVIYYKKKNRWGGKMMERVRNLLKGNFWKIDVSRVRLSSVGLDFLSCFFNISFDRFIDDLTEEERAFIVLEKKPKFIHNSYVN